MYDFVNNNLPPVLKHQESETHQRDTRHNNDRALYICQKFKYKLRHKLLSEYCKALNICEPLIFANFANGLNSQK